MPYQRPPSAIKLEDPTLNSVRANVKPVAVEPTTVPPDNITNLLSTLLKAGVVSASATPTGAGATAQEKATIADVPKEVDAAEAIIREYRDTILSESINLNSLDSIR